MTLVDKILIVLFTLRLYVGTSTSQGHTFACDLLLGHFSDCWKGIAKEYNSDDGIHDSFL